MLLAIAQHTDDVGGKGESQVSMEDEEGKEFSTAKAKDELVGERAKPSGIWNPGDHNPSHFPFLKLPLRQYQKKKKQSEDRTKVISEGEESETIPKHHSFAQFHLPVV